jgi:hypothetical protein
MVVQGPSTVVCMIVTSLHNFPMTSSAPYSGLKVNEKHQPANQVTAANPKAMGRLSYATS